MAAEGVAQPTAPQVTGSGGSATTAAAWQRFRRNRSGLLGLVLVVALALVALLAPYLAPHDPFRTSRKSFARPLATEGHVLGTDHLGRDVLSNVIWGARVSLLVGVAAALTATLIGVFVGCCNRARLKETNQFSPRGFIFNSRLLAIIRERIQQLIECGLGQGPRALQSIRFTEIY